MTINTSNTLATVPHATYEDILSDVRVWLEEEELDAREDAEGVPIVPYSRRYFKHFVSDKSEEDSQEPDDYGPSIGKGASSSTLKLTAHAPSAVVAKSAMGSRCGSDTTPSRDDDIVAPRHMKPIDFTRLFTLDSCSLPGSPPSTPGHSRLSPEDTSSSSTSDESIYEGLSLYGSPLLSPKTPAQSTSSSDADTNKSTESSPCTEGSPSLALKDLPRCKRRTRVSMRQRYKINPFDPTCLRRSQRLRLKAEEKTRKAEKLSTGMGRRAERVVR